MKPIPQFLSGESLPQRTCLQTHFPSRSGRPPSYKVRRPSLVKRSWCGVLKSPVEYPLLTRSRLLRRYVKPLVYSSRIGLERKNRGWRLRKQYYTSNFIRNFLQRSLFHPIFCIIIKFRITDYCLKCTLSVP